MDITYQTAHDRKRFLGIIFKNVYKFLTLRRESRRNNKPMVPNKTWNRDIKHIFVDSEIIFTLLYDTVIGKLYNSPMTLDALIYVEAPKYKWANINDFRTFLTKFRVKFSELGFWANTAAYKLFIRYIINKSKSINTQYDTRFGIHVPPGNIRLDVLCVAWCDSGFPMAALDILLNNCHLLHVRRLYSEDELVRAELSRFELMVAR